MGNVQASPGVDKSDLIQLFGLELPFDTQFERQLGHAKILKTAKVKSTSRDGHLVIKVYVKPILAQSNQQQIDKLDEFIRENKQKYYEIQSKWTLDNQPGLIPLIPIENRDKVQSHLHRGYFLGRQYLSTNLLDRFNTPPYLTVIEKKWIVYQLLRCVQQAHSTNIVHGDIKSENVLLTSWGWCFLTDFNPYKPQSIPFDDPYSWSLFFEDNRRPRCYLAPERFYTAKTEDQATTVQPASDIFSLGCVIAEIFMDGQVLFDLSQLLKYKTHGFDDYDPTILLAKKVDDQHVRQLIEHCINLDPQSRWTPQKYLEFYRGTIFPSYFDEIYELFRIFLKVTFSDADAKIRYLRKKYVDILRMVSGDKYRDFDFNAMVPEIFRKEKRGGNTPSLHSNMTSAGTTVPNTPALNYNGLNSNPYSESNRDQSGIPRLERIMKQQKLQQQQEMKMQNIHEEQTQNEDSQTEADNDEFIQLHDYNEDQLNQQRAINPTASNKLSGIGLALQQNEHHHQRSGASSGSTSSPSSPNSTNNRSRLQSVNSNAPRSPVSARKRRRSSGITHGLASVVSAAYKGNDTRLLNNEDIEELTNRLNTMTAVGKSVQFTNTPSGLVLDMKQYNAEQSLPDDKSASVSNFAFPIPLQSHNSGSNGVTPALPTITPALSTKLSTNQRAQRAETNRLRMQERRKQVISAKMEEQQQMENEGKENVIGNGTGTGIGTESGSNQSNTTMMDQLSDIFHEEDRDEFEGLILMSNVVCSALRNCRKASARLVALEIIGGFAEYLHDDIRLDRLVPYVRALIHDDKKKIHEEHSVVVAKAIQVLSSILSKVLHVPSKYTRLFPDYILETLKLLVDGRREEIIRIEIARQLATLALTGKYFIDYRDKDRRLTKDAADTSMSSLNSPLITPTSSSGGGTGSGGGNNVNDPASIARNDLYRLRVKVSQLIDPLFGTDQYASVQRALLSNCTQLCEFLGAKFTESKLIPGLFTFFNRREWQLRVSFLDVVVGISFYIGKQSLHKVLLPCLEECLNDARPAVVQRCLEAFTSLTEMNIFQSQLLLSRIQQIVPLVVHYSAWVRNSCINFLLTAAGVLGDVRAHCRMLPILEPYLQFPIVFITRETLTASLKQPLTVSNFNLLIENHKKANLTEIMRQKVPLLIKDQPLYDGILSYIRCVKFLDRSDLPNHSGSGTSGDHHHGNGSGTSSSSSTGTDLSNTNHHGVHGVHDDNTGHHHPQQKDVKPPRLWSVRIEPTVQSYVGNMNQLPQAVMLANPQIQLNGSGDGDETDTAWHDLKQSVQAITSVGLLRDRGRPAPRQTRSSMRDDAKIREALELPPLRSGREQQDKLKFSQLSYGSFYKNHQPPYQTYGVPDGWKPRGRVITQLKEHEDAVNVMRVSRDNLFVATASNDSTVKIWSCDKMHRCASIKSEQTYNGQKGEIISLAILDSSHTIASGSRDGTIHIFRVEYHDGGQNNHDNIAGLQSKFTLVPEEGGVVSMEHFNTFTESLIVFGTQAGNIHAWDMRRKKTSFVLPMEPAMGAITAMCIGPSIHSVIVGTARGFIVVFDLRFEMPVQMWRHYDASPIVSLTVINSKSIIHQQRNPELTHPEKGPLVLVSTERSNEICAFDLTTGTCRVRFRNSITKQHQYPSSSSSSSAAAAMTAMDEDQQSGAARRQKSNSLDDHKLSKKGLFSIFASKSDSNRSNKSVDNVDASSYNKTNTPTSSSNRIAFAKSFAGSTGNTKLGLKISQLPSVYPAALGQCPASRPFSLPSIEASTVLTHRKQIFSERTYSAHHGNDPGLSRLRTALSGDSHNLYESKSSDMEMYRSKMSKRSKTVSSMDLQESSSLIAAVNGGMGGNGVGGGFKSADKNRMKFSYHHSSSSGSKGKKERGFVYNCGFMPTVLNRALNVNVIGDELEQLCSSFGHEHGGSTGVLIAKDQFLISAGRDRVVRYWDMQQPQKSFRISNTSPNTTFTYNAYRDKKYNEVVFEELIEFEEEDYADLNEKQDTGTISSSKKAKHDSKAVHQDIITDLKAVEYPQKMLLTASRNGIVKVWI